MINYVKTDGENNIMRYPYTVEDMRIDNRNVSFPRVITPAMMVRYNAFPVYDVDTPDCDPKVEKIETEALPVYNEETNKWSLVKNVVSKTVEEKLQYKNEAKAEVRAKRDKLLAETDHLGLSDQTMSSEMVTYRQELRDITALAHFPYLTDDDWPTKP